MHRRLLVAVAIATLLLTWKNLGMSDANAQSPDPLAGNRKRFEAREFVQGDKKLLYRMLAPKDVAANKKYPLVIFLHGAGERGADNAIQLVHGMNEFASDVVMDAYPAFVVAPQCPAEQKWVDVDWTLTAHKLPEKPSESMTLVLGLIDSLVGKHPMVDPDRVYITGLSMGGYGTWDAISRRPELFAAAAPICGGGDPAQVGKFAKTPIWVLHGDQDEAVKPIRSREMVDALKAAGGKPKYTEWITTGHDSWNPSYRNPDFYAWLFAQKRAK